MNGLTTLELARACVVVSRRVTGVRPPIIDGSWLFKLLAREAVDEEYTESPGTAFVTRHCEDVPIEDVRRCLSEIEVALDGGGASASGGWYIRGE
jgi:hypothetical protein